MLEVSKLQRFFCVKKFYLKYNNLICEQIGFSAIFFFFLG